MSSTDLTQGSILKQLVKYSIPLVISGLLQAMYSMADMIIAGHFVGAAGLSAISNSSQITMMTTNILIGITTGGNILIGQYFGAKDREGCHESTATLFSMGLLIGTVLAAVFFFIARPLLSMLGAPSLEDATIYLKICSIGFIFVTGYNATTAALRAVGNSKAPLYCIAATSVLNVVLDLIFVGAMSMGTAGAALATVISQLLSFIISLAIVLRHQDLFGLRLSRIYMRAAKAKSILRLGVPCAVQMSIASISWLSVTYLINSYGVFVSAGNGVSTKIKDFCQLFIGTMSNAAASMIAQNIGAKKYDRAREILYTAMKITMAIAALLIVVVQLLAPQLVSIFTTDPETAAAAVKNLRIEIFGQIFYASFLVYHSLAIGAGHTWFAFFSSFVNCIFVRLILAFTLNHFFGITGLYFACMIAPAASVPLGLWYERSNRWRHSLVV